MIFKELREEVVLYSKCSATLSLNTRAFWKGKGRPGNRSGSDTCAHKARYSINGQFFCKKHAGFYLIDNYKKLGLDNAKNL